VQKQNKMLKLFNYLSKSTTKTICHRISTSAVSRKSNELVKSREDDYSIKEINKKPTRAPLAKNFFVGKVDTELMAFPEAIFEVDYHKKVSAHREEYEKLLDEHIFSHPDDKKNIEKLKDLSSFQSVPLLLTEQLYRMTEIENKYLSYSSLLNNHRHVMSVINEFGENSQKLSYIQRLENGDLIGIPMIHEYTRSTHKLKVFSTEAKYKESNEMWVLNGEKSFNLISPINFNSSLFLVFASTVVEDKAGDLCDSFSAFLVEATQPGVTVSKVEDTIGMKEEAFNQVRVTFKNVELAPCKLKY
jgi:acyl-CoA dehydrogenase family member 9